MKKIYFKLLIVLALGISNSIYSQINEEDKIAFERVQNLISSEDYNDALNVLENVSEKAKTNNSYFLYKGICYEKNKDYDSAINFYRQLYNKSKSDKALKGIARCKNLKLFEEKKLKQKMNCQKCGGTGYYSESVYCTDCNGSGKIETECRDCFGKGTLYCSNCNGKGWTTGLTMLKSMTDMFTGKNPNNQVEKVSCTSCKGKGTKNCSSCSGEGKKEYGCSTCNGTGIKSISIKCFLHE